MRHQTAELSNAVGEWISYVRDGYGRVVEQRDSTEAATTFAYDGQGRLIEASNVDARLQLVRDVLGRTITEKVNGREIHLTYDMAGRRTARVTPSGRTSAWTYDAAGRPVELVVDGHRVAFTYDAAGRETHRTIDDLLGITSEWAGSGNLLARSVLMNDSGGVSATGSARTLEKREWTYRQDGFPTSIDNLSTGRKDFDLDALGRIREVRAAEWTESYAYDPTGNLTASSNSRSSDGPGPEVREIAGTRPLRTNNRIAYEYDGQGRLTRAVKRLLTGGRKEWTFAYDVHDRMVAAVLPSGERWRYRYDPLGRRIAKQLVDTDDTVLEETRFTWDDMVMVEECRDGLSEAQSIVTSWDYEPQTWAPIVQARRVAAADGHDQQYIDEQFHAIVVDLVGTPTELVALNGAVEWRNTTDLWGRAQDTPNADRVSCLLRFPGQYYDGETGLHYNLHRYYDPQNADYTTADPLGLAPSPNQFGYPDNPLAWADPLGLMSGRPSRRPNDPLTFFRDFTGRVDVFPFEGGTQFEIHVYKGGYPNEYGVFGSEGWFPKHGLGVPTDAPPELESVLKGYAVDQMRRIGILKPGDNIKGDAWKRPRSCTG